VWRTTDFPDLKTNGAARGWSFIFPGSKLETERGLSALEGIGFDAVHHGSHVYIYMRMHDNLEEKKFSTPSIQI
jgi:hypothetical protein